jgi:hypothetical protein
VIGHTDESVELLDGPERVVLTGDELNTVIVLAASADKYAQRVSVKSRALGRAHNWCDVAEQAIEELNSTPEKSDDESSERIHVVVTTTGHYTVRRANRRHAPFVTDENMLEIMRERFYVGSGGEFNFDYFQHVRGATNPVVSVDMRVVDEFPSANGTAEVAEAAASTSSTRRRR